LSGSVVVRREVRKRGFFGKLVKYGFILFNVVMLMFLLGSCGNIAEVSQTAVSDAEKAGVAIGATLATGMILAVWTFGSLILGILTLPWLNDDRRGAPELNYLRHVGANEGWETPSSDPYILRYRSERDKPYFGTVLQHILQLCSPFGLPQLADGVECRCLASDVAANNAVHSSLFPGHDLLDTAG